MSDSLPLRPSRVVAIFPFGVSAPQIDGRQADLCRGLAVLVERRLGRLPGVQPLLQNLFISSESDPSRKGWLVTNSLWSLDQALSLPIVNGEEPTHLLQGLVTWEGDDIRVEMELIDLGAGYSLIRQDHTGPANNLIETFFRVFRPVSTALMESSAAGRVVSRLPTRDNSAFEHFCLGLAAVQAHAQGMVSSAPALQLLTECVEKDGELIEATGELELFIQGMMTEAREVPAPVLDSIRRVRVAAPWNHSFLALEGLLLARSGAAQQAIPLLKEYLTHDSRGEVASQVMTALARIHRENNNLSGARELLHAATSASPENASAWEELADCHAAAGEVTSAEQCWRRALQEDPDRNLSLAALGETYLRRGDHERANPLLRRAHELSDGSPATTALLAECHLAAGRLEEADELATTWAEQSPETLESWSLLARIRHKRRDSAAVAHCLRMAGRLATTHTAKSELSMLDFSFRQPLEYAEFRRIERQTEMTPQEAQAAAWKLTSGVFSREVHPPILQLVSRLAERGGDPLKAAHALAMSMERLEGGDLFDHRRLARLYVDGRKTSTARITIDAAEARWPGDAELARLRHEIDDALTAPEPLPEVAPSVPEPPPRTAEPKPAAAPWWAAIVRWFLRPKR